MKGACPRVVLPHQVYLSILATLVRDIIAVRPLVTLTNEI